MSSSLDFVGILPAAGLGTRLPLLRAPKELLPVAFYWDAATGVARPVLAAECSLGAIKQAEVRKCFIVINDRKPEILRYFGDGGSHGISIAYLNQAEPLGLACAVDCAFEWVKNACVSLALPDTVFTPQNAIAVVNRALVRTGADVVLGVFPTDRPSELGPVRMTSDGTVLEVLEKPTATDLRNTWGIAAWNPTFTAFLHRSRDRLRHQSLGAVFNDAVGAGLKVAAHYFDDGSYLDLGTAEGIAAMIFDSWTEVDGLQTVQTIVASHARRLGVGTSGVGARVGNGSS